MRKGKAPCTAGLGLLALFLSVVLISCQGNGKNGSSGGSREDALIVPADTEAWVNSGLNLKAGDRLFIQASGTVVLAEGGAEIGPEGDPGKACNAECPLPSSPAGALIGWIGTEIWAPFVAGTDYSGVADQNGRLYLRVNDDTPADNAGFFRVTLRVEPGEGEFDDDSDDDTADDDDDSDDDTDDDTDDDDTDDDDLDDDSDDDLDDDLDDDIDDDLDDDADDDVESCPEVEGVLAEPEMVLVEAGVFLMGSPEEELGHLSYETQHQVQLTRDFFMGTFEVTQSLWKGVMGALPNQYVCGDDYPVGTVTWDAAVEFCNALSLAFGYTPCYAVGPESVDWDWDCDGYRLPTEAEWEYAARAGSETAFYNGEITNPSCGDPLLGAIAWYCGSSGFDLHPVGQKTPSDWGLYDIHGNVWEWAWDGFDSEDDIPYPVGPAVDPTGPGGVIARSYRGGSMFAVAADCRAAYRRFGNHAYLDEDNGMRLVRNVPD